MLHGVEIIFTRTLPLTKLASTVKCPTAQASVCRTERQSNTRRLPGGGGGGRFKWC